MKDFEQRLRAIEARNNSVELEKAWETSWMRRGLIAFFTFASIGTYMWAIGIPNPLMNAIIPTAGFLLSTLTMPFFKRWWLKGQKEV